MASTAGVSHRAAGHQPEEAAGLPQRRGGALQALPVHDQGAPVAGGGGWGGGGGRGGGGGGGWGWKGGEVEGGGSHFRDFPLRHQRKGHCLAVTTRKLQERCNLPKAMFKGLWNRARVS